MNISSKSCPTRYAQLKDLLEEAHQVSEEARESFITSDEQIDKYEKSLDRLRGLTAQVEREYEKKDSSSVGQSMLSAGQGLAEPMEQTGSLISRGSNLSRSADQMIENAILRLNGSFEDGKIRAHLREANRAAYWVENSSRRAGNSISASRSEGSSFLWIAKSIAQDREDESCAHAGEAAYTSVSRLDSRLSEAASKNSTSLYKQRNISAKIRDALKEIDRHCSESTPLSRQQPSGITAYDSGPPPRED